MIHIDRYEKAWLTIAAVVMAIFVLAIGVSAFAYGIQVPVPEQRVDPGTISTPGVSPFAQPMLRELAPKRYEAFITAEVWRFNPAEITVPKGSTVTFYLTSKDVQHGFKIDRTNINMMVLPGQVSKLTTRFDMPGTYNFICDEYCGIGHQTMYGKLIVEP